jgi:NADPH:quinone reductase-like Zn-dependent oxidoreductase
MKAIIYDKKQSPLKVYLGEVPVPIAKDNEVLIKVIFGCLNAADYRSIQMGLIGKGKVVGSAVSGVVASVGKAVSSFKPGDEVFADLADCGFGGFAEFAIAPETAVAHKPANTSFEDIVTLPVAAPTALKALRDKGSIREGQHVLIVGSAGGVGSFAVQLAKYYGAKVTAVCSTKNIEQSIALGADEVIDYTQTDFTKASSRYDLILAINGNYSLLGYRRLLKPGGIYVMVGGKMAQIFKSLVFGPFLSFGGKKMKALSAKTDSEDLAIVGDLMDSGKIRTVIEKYYPLDKFEEALTYVKKGHARGKVILEIQKPSR